jgi:hypothetical protein
MSIEEKVPMNRTSITIVIVVLLCAAGLAYSQGWFNWSNASYETGSNEVRTDQTIEQESRKGDVPPVTQQTTDSATTSTE